MRYCTLLFSLLTAVCAAQYGQLDPTFDSDGTVVVDLSTETWQGSAIAQQSTGAYVVAGLYLDSTGASHTLVLRLNPDGSLDPTFGPNGNGVLQFPVSHLQDEAFSVAVRPDDRIIVGGNAGFASYYQWYLLGLTADGLLDNTFGTIGSVACDSTGSTRVYMNDMILDGSGAILLCGDTPEPTGTVIRRDATGAADLSFGSSGFASAPSQAVNCTGRALTIDDQGRILLSGSHTQSGADNLSAVVRFSPSGVFDATFGSNGLAALNLCSGISERFNDVQQGTDGTIVLAGWKAPNGIYSADMAVVRLLDNGSQDATFGTAGVSTYVLPDFAYGFAARAIVQADGGVNVCIVSQQPAPSEAMVGVARLGVDGSLDPAFGTDGVTLTNLNGALTREIARDMILDDQGRLVVVGFSGGSDERVFVARYAANRTNAIQDRPTYEELRAFPNPCSDRLNLVIPGNRMCTYQLMGIEGRLLLSGTGPTIATGSLVAGPYIVRVTTGDQEHTLRIVKD